MIPSKTRLGDSGESEIKSRLQRFSTVDKVDRDVGIDFFCELIINNIPLIPYYVQAKSTNQIDRKGGNSINKSTIQYWLSKPHPVYIIFYDHQADICYWKSIEEDRYKLIDEFFKTESKTIYIKCKHENILDKTNPQEFINQITHDYHSLSLYYGTPQFIGSGYVKQNPKSPRTINEYNKIVTNTRASLHSIIGFHIQKGEFTEAIKYAEAIALFDKSHYNHFAWLGYCDKETNQINKALKNFKLARSICKRDTKWERNSINQIIQRLDSEIESLAKK